MVGAAEADAAAGDAEAAVVIDSSAAAAAAMPIAERAKDGGPPSGRDPYHEGH